MNPLALKQNSETNKNDWCTPLWLFNRLQEVFDFNVDGAATKENSLCEFFDSNFNPYNYNSTARIFINPPFNNISPFIGVQKDCFRCLLLPFRPETKLWHFYIWPECTVFVFNKRIQYIHPETKKEVKGAAFPSCLVLYGDLSSYPIEKLCDLGVFIKRC